MKKTLLKKAKRYIIVQKIGDLKLSQYPISIFEDQKRARDFVDESARESVMEVFVTIKTKEEK